MKNGPLLNLCGNEDEQYDVWVFHSGEYYDCDLGNDAV